MIHLFEKNLGMGLLLDFYGDLLPKKRRTVMDYYYNDDLSLAEIADEIGISRQGVREQIKKTEEELAFYEEKLGLAARFSEMEIHITRALALCRDCQASPELTEEIRLLSACINQ